ncbi:MAG: hisK [Clostridiaceae bacterium]|nr:hisK [Clostridiaceae bacterium]
MDNKKIIRDGHIHSPYCPHGTNDSFDMYIKKALKVGLKEITFTEHMPLPWNFMDPEFLKTCAPALDKIHEYFNELDYVKSKYKDTIKINTGLEVDYIDDCDERIKEMLNKYGEKLEDSILSVHFIKIDQEYFCVDVSPEGFGTLVEKLGGVDKVYDRYYETLLKAVKSDLGPFKPKRIGHATLVRIFNKQYPLEYRNVKLLEEIVREIKERNYEIDYNTAGTRKPYCNEIYPSGIFADLVQRYKVNIVYGSDAHTASQVGYNF